MKKINFIKKVTPLSADTFNQMQNNIEEEFSQVNSHKADKTEVQALQTQLQSVASGSPKGVYSTLSDLQTAFPSGNNNIYVVSTDGKWYYWNGSAWTAGGTYQSTGIAEGTVTPNMTSFMQYKYQFLKASERIYGAYYRRQQTTALPGTVDSFPPFRVKAGVTYYFRQVYGYFSHVQYDDGTFVSLKDDTIAPNIISGDFTPTKDGTMYITVADLSSGSSNAPMFANAPLPENYVEGYYDITIPYIQGQIDNINSQIDNINSNAIVPTEVTVDINGSGDYTNLRTCFESISPSEKRPYIVNILPGEYNIKSYYTAQEWITDSTLFRGLYIPDYVTLRGVGDREKIILYVDETPPAKQHISTINLKNTAGMENITVRGKYVRYAVHDDKADEATPYKRRIKNCHFICENTYYNVCYGSGVQSGADWEFENCIFENLTSGGTAFSCHNPIATMTKDNFIKFTNCRFKANAYGLNFGSLTNNANGKYNYVTVNGCKSTGKLRLREENAATYGAGIIFRVTGYYSTFTGTEIVNTDGKDYSSNIDII